MQPPPITGGGGATRELENHHSHHHHHHHHNNHSPSYETEGSQPHDDFLEQMLSNLPNCSWPHDLSNNNNPSNPNRPASGDGVDSDDLYNNNPPSSAFDGSSSPNDSNNNGAGSVKSFLLQQQLLMSRGGGGDPGRFVQLPLSLSAAHHHPDSIDPRLLLHHHHQQHDVVDAPPTFKSPPLQGADGAAASVQALFNSFAGPLHGNGQAPNPQQPLIQAGSGGGGMPAPTFGMNQQPTNGAASDGSPAVAAAPPQRQRIRARRGQATDPHSIAERLRRERIAERMKALQELVPNANKTDKASMLDEIIDYVKFLQLQVKVLSMSRLGGAAAVAPGLVADMSSEGGRGTGAGGSQTGDREGNNGTNMEHQVAKMMEEDMGSAMQYLQGKGLCLMPISLATAISTATTTTASRPTHPLLSNPASLHQHRRHPPPPPGNNNVENGDGPSSPNLSALTVQSSSLLANGAGAAADAAIKDPKS